MRGSQVSVTKNTFCLTQRGTINLEPEVSEEPVAYMKQAAADYKLSSDSSHIG